MAAPKKSGLGRGLESLFGEVGITPQVSEEAKPYGSGADKATDTDPENSILYININDIKPNTNQPRKRFDEDKIEELAASIQEHGIIQPIVVRRLEKGYEIVAGERRYRAARKAELKQVPCILRELTDEQNMLLAIIENMQREDLNPIEEAEAMDKLINAYGLTQEQVSKSVGKSRPYITNVLRLLRLPQEIREMVAEGELTQGHARALINIGDEKKQLLIARRAKEEGLSVRTIEQLSGELTTTAKRKKARPRRKNPDEAKVEEELKQALGTRVNLKQKGKTGLIEIEYYSREELERLIELLRSLG